METARTYELAGIGERFAAIFIDTILLSIVGGILSASTHWWGGSLVGIILGAAYQWYFLTQHGGQTPGKMLMNIRVIKVDGSPIRDADAVLRFAGYYLNSMLLGLGWLWALFDANSQGWHDKLANTYVVKAPKESTDKRKNDQVTI